MGTVGIRGLKLPKSFALGRASPDILDYYKKVFMVRIDVPGVSLFLLLSVFKSPVI